jgi:hypothetical protein
MPQHLGELILIFMFLIYFGLFRRQLGGLKNSAGKCNKLHTNLLTLKQLSWVILIFAGAMPFITHISGEKTENWVFWIFIVGFMGITISQVLQDFDSRISVLEKTGGAEAEREQ